jgi:hypothetical protein
MPTYTDNVSWLQRKRRWQSNGTLESDTTTNGTVTNRRIDTRVGVKRVKPKPWADPTAYERIVEMGSTTCLEVQAYMDYIWNNKLIERIEYVGGTNNPGGGNLNDPKPSFPSGMVTRAEVNALLKLKDQDINLSQAFGERAQTAGMIADTATRLARAVRRVRRGDVRGCMRELGIARGRTPRGTEPHNQWLQLQYGWLPLLGDAYGSAKELAEKDRESPDRYNATCISRIVNTEKAETQYDLRFGSLFHFPCRIYKTTTFDCKVRLDYVRENEVLASLSELGITNPLSLAWELLPFSFVADWFIPIGDYLSVMDATVGWSYKGGSLSKTTRVKRQFITNGLVHGVPQFSNERYTGYCIFNRGNDRYVHLKREVYPTSPLPWLPSFDGGLNLRRSANAIALLRQAFT